jgi:beta-glucosidase
MKARYFAWLSVLGLGLAGGVNAQTRADCPGTAGKAQPWLDRNASPMCRAHTVLESIGSLEDKLTILMAGPEDSSKWLTDRGLPALGASDGPAGVRAGGMAVTAFPTPLGMAASFDPETARLYGSLIGKEFIDSGLNVMTGPALDVPRTWHFGRTTESLGEDPSLIAAMVAPEIQGIQGQHVIATAKHFAVYNQEQGRAGDAPLRARPASNAMVDERTIREIYLPGFEAAIRSGGAGRVMCAFPRINGIYACENRYLLDILKKEWGFDGIVEPDFPDAQRSIVQAINAGLDTGIMAGTTQPPRPSPSGALLPLDNRFNDENLREAVRAGKISQSRIDDLILRRLVPGFRVGAFDNPGKRVTGDVSTPERRIQAADIVVRGAVLLKNNGHLLPLSAKVGSIAVIGHQAGSGAVVAELGSGRILPSHLAPVLPALRTRAGNKVRVRYAQGTLGLDPLAPMPVAMIRMPDGNAGFRAEYFDNAQLNFSAAPFLTRQESSVDNHDIPRRFPADHRWSARWTGLFTPDQSGVQHFTLVGSGTARLFIDGKLMGHFDFADFTDTLYANGAMTAGKPVEIRVEWTPRSVLSDTTTEAMGTMLGPVVHLGWSGPNDLIATAVAAARKAEMAIVFVGHKVGEGADRMTLALPNDQDALIAAVAAANPRTIVVLQTGGAVTMPWLNKVAAVLEMWLPGDAFGPAAARLIFGDDEPGGRLPVTFPKNESQGPAQQASQYPGTQDAGGALQDVHYDEGLEVGYRFWDAHDQIPLFPFGYGLSYAGTQISAHAARPTADGGAEVDISLKNTGARPGSEVVQAYVGFPGQSGEPPKQLKAFRKVMLKPGESRSLTMKLEPRAFAHWAEHHWRVTAGTYRIMVGRSSRDMVYQGQVELPDKDF